MVIVMSREWQDGENDQLSLRVGGCGRTTHSQLRYGWLLWGSTVWKASAAASTRLSPLRSLVPIVPQAESHSLDRRPKATSDRRKSEASSTAESLQGYWHPTYQEGSPAIPNASYVLPSTLTGESVAQSGTVPSQTLSLRVSSFSAAQSRTKISETPRGPWQYQDDAFC